MGEAAARLANGLAVTRRVLLVETSAWGGGLERVVLTIAQGATPRGWDALVAHWRKELPPGAGVAAQRLHAGRVLRRWPWELRGLVRRVRPDVIHLHGPTAGSLGAVAVRDLGPPVLYTDHFVHADRPWPLRILRRLASRVPDASIAISSEVRRSLIEDAGAPRASVHTIVNGVDRVAEVERSAEPRAAYVANLWPRKDHLGLLDALARTRAPVDLVLVGGGPARPTIEAEIEARGLAGRVTLAGAADGPWAAAAPLRFVVHPPRAEGMPLAVAEAMMRGLPIVATDVGGIPDMLEDGRTGLLVPPGDPAALAAAMDRLATDDGLCDRLASAARAEALARFTVEVNLDATFALYERLLGTSA